MCFFKVKHSTRHISGMVGLIDGKWKGGASVGYWVNYVTLTFDLDRDLDLWFFKVKFQNSCISGIVIWLMWNKKNTNQLDTGLKKKKKKKIRYWADCMVLPFDHTHDPDLVVSMSKFEIALFEEWGWGGGFGGGGADWHGKGCESIIHDHDRNLWITLVGWVGVVQTSVCHQHI